MTAEFEDDATDVGTVSKQREVSGRRRRGTKDEETYEIASQAMFLLPWY